MPYTITQEYALREYRESVRSAKATLNGKAVEKVLDSFADNVDPRLTALASEASMALSALLAYLDSPGHHLDDEARV